MEAELPMSNQWTPTAPASKFPCHCITIYWHSFIDNLSMAHPVNYSKSFRINEQNQLQFYRV